MTFCDSHLHIVQCTRRGLSLPGKDDFAHMLSENALPSAESGLLPDAAFVYKACTCAHDPTEFADFQQTAAFSGAMPVQMQLVSAFGLHPQEPHREYAPFLEGLLQSGAIGAVGEAGFDLYTSAFAENIASQEEVWHLQLELAACYKKPLIVHCRKAQALLFRDSALLKKIPAVVFHSFMGSEQEAKSLLARGINGYFSFGKPLLNGKKSAIACVRALPPARLLLETDAPFQTLKGEEATAPAEIVRVYAAAAKLRACSMDFLCAQLDSNFAAAFGVM